LEGEHQCDVVVIGGGYTGLHAALNARERGFSVVVLEAGRIGFGASGRNGGQMIPGWRKGAVELIEKFGVEKARALFDLAMEARALTLERIAKHNIACDLRTKGHLTASAKPAHQAGAEGERRALADVMNYHDAEVLSREEARALCESPAFFGAFLDKGGGHLHPLNYALGLAQAARDQGVVLHENARVVSVSGDNGVVARTENGVVRARFGILACDALLHDLEPRIAGHIMPVANYIVATEPLKHFPIHGDLAVSDSRFVVDYFRISADNRLIFGGGEKYTPAPPPDLAAFVRPFMLRIFPQLANCRIDHAWGGLVSITMSRFPHVGRFGDLFFAHGYSGQGVLLPALVGKVLAEAMAGTAERFDILSSLAPPEFPGSAALRAPLYTLGMLWYALRDRL
jgi:gamma-glutamylputrescine oxidase